MRMHTPMRPGIRTHARANTHTHTQICNIYRFSQATTIRERASRFVVCLVTHHAHPISKPRFRTVENENERIVMLVSGGVINTSVFRLQLRSFHDPANWILHQLLLNRPFNCASKCTCDPHGLLCHDCQPISQCFSCLSKYFTSNQKSDFGSFIIPIVPFIHVVLQSENK